MKDVMVDLETLGNTPGSAILSIGAVAFDPETGEIDDPGLYTVINVNSCVVAGLRFDQDTLDWWAQQSDEARKVLKMAWSQGGSMRLTDALHSFSRYVDRFGGSGARVWGNGADFDNAMLSAAYKAAGIAPGWKFWNSRCFRTLKNLYPKVTFERVGTHHNALDDAKTQAVHALRIFAQIARDQADGQAISSAVEHLEAAGFTADEFAGLLAPEEDLIG